MRELNILEVNDIAAGLAGGMAEVSTMLDQYNTNNSQ